MNNSADIFFPLGGGITGASIYSTIGGVGIIGSFGGCGVGIAGMTTGGVFLGSAFYGAIKGLEDNDPNAFLATGLGVVGGIGTLTIFGGVGISFGGTAFGIGMCSMSLMGGIFGLGIYGVAKMFDSSSRSESFDDVYNRIEDKVIYEGAYFQAMLELSPIFAEMAWKQKYNYLEIEAELQQLKDEINNNFKNTDNIEPEDWAIELKDNFVWKSTKVLWGHTASINSLSVSNNHLVSASDDNTASLWNLETGKILSSFYEPSSVSSVTINDRIILGANQNRNITSWNLATTNLEHIFRKNSRYLTTTNSDDKSCHDGLIHDLILSNDGKTLFSSSGDRTIRIWNAITGDFKYTLNGHQDLVLSLAITSDDRFLISASGDRTIKIWDLTNLCSQPKEIMAHKDWVTSLAISSDNKYLVSGSRDKTVKLWNLDNLKLIYCLEHGSEVWSVAISSDSETIVSASSNNTVKLWELATGNIVQILEASSPIVFNNDGKYLITTNQKNQIVVWQRNTIKNQITIDSNIPQPWWIILGIKPNASHQQIKEAFHNLAKQYHPDRNSSIKAEATMQIINQAYSQAIKN